MDGCLVERLSMLAKSSPSQVKQILVGESANLEITKSILNLLHNIVVVGSVPVSTTQREFLDSNTKLVLDLLSRRKTLQSKRQILLKNPNLAIAISASCLAGL